MEYDLQENTISVFILQNLTFNSTRYLFTSHFWVKTVSTPTFSALVHTVVHQELLFYIFKENSL